MYYKVTILLVFLAICSMSLQADEIQLQNGDVLSGKILNLVDGKLTFQSDLAGEVVIDLSSIQTVSTDEPVSVNLQDKTGFTQRLLSAAPGRFAIAASDSLEAQDFSVSDIVSINPPARPIPKWTGSISAGLTSVHGNTKTDSLTASINLKKRTEKDRTTLSFDYAKSEQEDKTTGNDETIEDWWRAKAKYDYFFSEKLYGYIDGRYEKDAIAYLDRRTVIGIGAGYQWIESDKTNFSTEAGLASLYEKFDNQTDSNSEISFQVGYNFDTKLTDTLSFIHDLTFYPSIDRFSNYYLTTSAELRVDISALMFANFKAMLNYDASPASGQGNTDTKYFLGIGITF